MTQAPPPRDPNPPIKLARGQLDIAFCWRAAGHT